MEEPGSAEQLLAAVRRLRERLDDAFDGHADRYPPRHRARYSYALESLVEFLEHSGVANRHCHALMDLADGLRELDTGIVRPYLKPTSGFSNKHPDGSDVWRARAFVSAAFYALIRSGLSRSKAAAKVAGHKHLDVLPGKKAKNLESAAQSWFDDFNYGKVSHREAAQIFASQVALIDAGIAEHRELLSPERMQEKLRELATMMLTSKDLLTVSRPSD